MLIKNGWLWNDDQKQRVDVFIQDGKMIKIAPEINVEDEVIIDVCGSMIAPSFTDLHVHFRDPGQTYKEDLMTGSQAASHGGFTRVCTMPNVTPIPDTKAVFEQMVAHNKESMIEVLQYAPITYQLRSDEVVSMTSFTEAVAFTNDGVGVQSAGTMKKAMEAAKTCDKVIVAHVEDDSLLNGGSFHKGECSQAFQDKGISSESEYLQLLRDLALCQLTGCRYHVCHLSTKEGVDLIRSAKAKGIAVTCEVTPHHLLLNDRMLQPTGNYKMNPPIRTKEDQQALWEGLLDGTIDCIATDHAPHSQEEKQRAYQEAPFGIIGLELAFPLLYTYGVKQGKLSLQQLIMALSEKASEVLSLPVFEVKEGMEANLSIWQLDETITVTDTWLKSKGKNTPYQGATLYGKNQLTLSKGEIVYADGR